MSPYGKSQALLELPVSGKSLPCEGREQGPRRPKTDRRSRSAVDQQSRAWPQGLGRGQVPGLAPGEGLALTVPRVLSIRGTTKAETRERNPGWLGDQRRQDRARKRTGPAAWAGGQGSILAPFQVREGLVLESGMGLSLWLGAKLYSCLGRGAQAGLTSPCSRGMLGTFKCAYFYNSQQSPVYAQIIWRVILKTPSPFSAKASAYLHISYVLVEVWGFQKFYIGLDF